jgi:hypothetical protein
MLLEPFYHADRARFELAKPKIDLTVFRTVSFDRSDTYPTEN